MNNDNRLSDAEKNVDYMNSPEGNPHDTQDFSMEKQRQEFLSSGTTNQSRNEKSPRRLRLLEVSRLFIEKPNVIGLENLPSNPCVIATTHLSDIDVQEVAVVVAEQRKIGITSQATNLEFPLYKPFVKALGKENFFGITNAPYQGKNTAHSIRIEDFKNMEDGITKDGRTMIIAGHNPTRNWELAEKPGLGSVILAHLANVPIVPAALDIHSEKPVADASRLKSYLTQLRRPAATMIFGEPIQVSDIPEDKIQAVVNLYSPDERRNMTVEQIEAAKQTLEILQNEADQVMESLAAKLPPEKRGKWRQKSNPPQAPNEA